MVDQVVQLLGILGFDAQPPATMAELIPYLLHAGVAVGLLLATFNLFRFIISLLIRPRF